MNRVRGLLAGLLMLLPASACAQHVFIDTDNDGVRTSNDRLGSPLTTISIWLQTDANRDGSRPLALRRNAAPLSMFSYDILLHASDGTVEWGPYVNAQSGMDTKLGEFRSDTDFYVAYCGEAAVAPGTYKLGTMAVRVKSGTPAIKFSSNGPPGCYWAHTSFGSMNPGKEICANTIMFSENAADIGDSHKEGIWTDSDGTAASGISFAGSAPRFGVLVSPNPMNPTATITISTTRSGFLKVSLFDVQGRRVRTLADRLSIPPGDFMLRLNAIGKNRLASGVYFYRVEATEGRLDGRVVVTK